MQLPTRPPQPSPRGRLIPIPCVCCCPCASCSCLQDREAHLHDYPALSHPHVFVLQVGPAAHTCRPAAACLWLHCSQLAVWPPRARTDALPPLPTHTRCWIVPNCACLPPLCLAPPPVPACRAATSPSGGPSPSCAEAGTHPWTTLTTQRSSRCVPHVLLGVPPGVLPSVLHVSQRTLAELPLGGLLESGQAPPQLPPPTPAAVSFPAAPLCRRCATTW